MRYQDATAFRQALEQRLKDQAAGDGARLARNRKYVAFDRLLARLAAVAPMQWLLKGGFALDLRYATGARSTKDVDLDWRADKAELLDTLLDAVAQDLDDYFKLAIEATGVPEDRLGGSQRFRVSTALAGRPFESFVLDVGFCEREGMRSETLHTGELLTFAGIEPVEIEAVALEAQVAEKLHALTRSYRGGRTSTRPKDLVDIVLISAQSSLDAEALRREIHTAFADRATHPVPGELPPPPPDWSEPFRRLADEVGISSELEKGSREAATMLNPVLSGEVTAGIWDPKDRRWDESARNKGQSLRSG